MRKNSEGLRDFSNTSRITRRTVIAIVRVVITRLYVRGLYCKCLGLGARGFMGLGIKDQGKLAERDSEL